MIKNSLKVLLCMTAFSGFAMAGEAALSTEAPKAAKKAGAKSLKKQLDKAKKDVGTLEKELAEPKTTDTKKANLTKVLERKKESIKNLEEKIKEKITDLKGKIEKNEKQIKDTDDRKVVLTKRLEALKSQLSELDGAASSAEASPEVPAAKA